MVFSRHRGRFQECRKAVELPAQKSWRKRAAEVTCIGEDAAMMLSNKRKEDKGLQLEDKGN